MGCKFLYNGQWLEENELKAVFHGAPNTVNATMKVVDALYKIPRKTYPSNNAQGFYNDLIKQGVPKNQLELLKQHIASNNIKEINTNDLITSLLAEISYTVEINTATKLRQVKASKDDETVIRKNGQTFKDLGDPTQHYSNLTVPGGTNYTENEIATPQIIPSIKGHAQFATDNGIGWFRSDEQAKTILENYYVDYIEVLDKYVVKSNLNGKISVIPGAYSSSESAQEQADKMNKPSQIRKLGEEVISSDGKTRRILEVQSDLFQKGRLKEDLILSQNEDNVYNAKKEDSTREEFWIAKEKGKQVSLYNNTFYEYNGYYYDFLSFSDKYYKIEKNSKIDTSENQFLQLLNKDSNWVTFFVKSIIQDSAKKGYEKVLFPTGNTASKVEGHTTLEEFKKQKEDRLKQIQPDVILPIGTSGSGKSTFIKSLPQENLVVIEPDAMRVEFTGDMNNKSKDKEIYIEAANRAIKAIKQGKQVVFDTTNLTKDKRLPFIEAIKKAIPTANIQYKLMELNPELAKQRIKADIAAGKNRANVPDATIDRHAESYKQMLEDIKSESISNYETNETEINQLKQELERVETEGFGALKPIYNFYENTVTNILNKTYGKENVKQITDEYGNQWNEIGITPEIAKQTILFQAPGTEGSKASAKTLHLVNQWMERLDIKEKELPQYDLGGRKIDANGQANLLNDVIKIAEGKEEVALTEEAMHFAVAIIKQTNPQLFKQMMNKIGTFNYYKKIFNEYSKRYVNKDGTPDILKIKEEAIGKILAEYLIKDIEGATEKPELLAQTLSWWQQIKDFFLALIGKATFNPFETAVKEIDKIEDTKALDAPYKELADRIMEKESPGIIGYAQKQAYEQGKYRGVVSMIAEQLEDPETYQTTIDTYLGGDEGLAKEILKAGESFLQLSSKEEAVYDRIVSTSRDIEKKESLTKKDENGKPVDSYFYKGKEILKRVTDKAKIYYERLFGNKSITETEYQKAVKTIMADEGTNGHEDLQHAGSILIQDGKFNPDATLDTNYAPKTNKAIYKVLFDNLKERLATYPGAKFIQEVSVVDEKKDVAGTIDLLIVKEDGSVQIIDWKFINLNVDKFDDIPWFKQRAWNIQIAEYKRILSDRYGIPSYMIKGEAIPIKANYDYPGTVDGSRSLPILKSIEIGNVDVKTEERDYLLPVTLSGQDTGNKELNKLISKLNALHTNLENTEVKGTEEKAKKAEQLQFIDKAMRHLSVRNTIGPLINQASVYTKDVQRVIDIFNNTYKDRDFLTSPPSNQEISDYGIQLDNALSQINIYTNLDITLKSLAGTDVSAEAHKAHRELVAIVDDARFLEDALKNTINELGEKIANSLGFKDLTDPEPIVTAIARNFTETSKLPTQVLQVMFQKIREANNLSTVNTNRENGELEEIKKDYEKLAKSKGLNIKNMFSLVMDYKKNKLIDQFKGEFYTEVKAAIKDKDKGIHWILDNIDIEKYRKELAEDLQKKIDLINSRPWTEAEKTKEIEKQKREHDTSDSQSLGWFLHYYILRNSPIEEKWTSKEWKTLWEKGNEPAQRLYNWVRDINQKAEDAGYLPDDKAVRTFLPFVVKSFAEKLIFGGSLTVGEEFIRSMTVDSDTVGYGSIDPLTGKPILKIPKYFTSGTDKDLSTNLFKNLAIYNQALNRYKYISEVEGFARVLGRLERNKGSIITNQYGKALFDKETGQHELSEDNSKNAKLFDDQMATLIYGQKYIQSEKFDTLLSKVGGTFEKINKTLGVKIMPEGLSERQFSLNKSIDTLNRFFQQKTLGLNPLPALSNLVGGTLQITINSGKYMNKKELLASQANLASAAVRGVEGKKLMAAMEYFMPFTGNENFREMLHKLSLTKWTENNIQDFLMWMMRGGDKYVQATLFTTLWENAILVDGKVYNAREYIRKETSYKDRYSSGNIEEQEAKFNSLVAEIKEKYSLSKQAIINDKGKLVLPIERDSKEAFKLTNLSQALSKRTTGNLTPAEVRGINQNIWSNSFMVFKNWIPSLWDTRFGKQKYASDVDAYEWGRARTVGRIMLMDGVKSLSSLVDLITFNAFTLSTAGKMVKGTEEGLKSLQELYEYKKQQYFEHTGKQLDVSPEEFFDLVRQNIRNQAKDTLITLSLLAMFFAAKAIPPDPDEDKDVINKHKFLVRTLDKLSDEVSFYYLPTSFQSMLNGSVMPSVAVFSDGIRVITHTFTELYGDAFDENIADKNYVIKYLAKSFPVTSQMSSYMPLYAPDLAKELGIQLGSQARR